MTFRHVKIANCKVEEQCDDPSSALFPGSLYLGVRKSERHSDKGMRERQRDKDRQRQREIHKSSLKAFT